MKTIFTFCSICIFCYGAFAQKSSAEKKYRYITEQKVSRHTADSLLETGSYFQIYDDGIDFRYRICVDSLSKKYSFSILWFSSGCCLLSLSVFDSIETFNRSMATALMKINGTYWESEYNENRDSCIQCMCPIKGSLDQYKTSAAYLLYRHRQTGLDSAQRCIIDHELFQVLKDNPTLMIKLEGHSSASEGDTTKTLSRQRAENFLQYLISKGISKEQLSIAANGNDYPNTDDKQSPHLNRRVTLRVMGR